MGLSKTELIAYYKNTLQEIKEEKQRLVIEELKNIEEQYRREEKAREKVKNGTATMLDRFTLCIKINYLLTPDSTELKSLIKKARELAIQLWGEDVVFPTLDVFLKQIFKRIKKMLKYLNGKLSDTYQFLDDKRPLISQFRKLLIKVNQDDVDNSRTHINMKINRVLNLINKTHDDVIRYKESTYQHFVLQ